MISSPKYPVQLPDFDFWKAMVPCQEACPIHTDAGRYVQLIAQGEYEQAYLTARSPNPFASVCGRVCAAPCEDKCRRGALDAPVSIRALKRFVTEKFGVESLAPDTQDQLIQMLDRAGQQNAVAPADAARQPGECGARREGGGDRRRAGGSGVRPRSGADGLQGHGFRGVRHARAA